MRTFILLLLLLSPSVHADPFSDYDFQQNLDGRYAPRPFCCATEYAGYGIWCILTIQGAAIVSNYYGTNFQVGDLQLGSACGPSSGCSVAEGAVCGGGGFIGPVE